MNLELDLVDSISFAKQDDNKIKINLAIEVRKEKEGDKYYIFIEKSPESGSIEEHMLRDILMYYSKIHSSDELSVWVKDDENAKVSNRILKSIDYNEVQFKVFSMYTQYIN